MLKIEIMCADPTITIDGATHRMRNDAAGLLRLLVLKGGRVVPQDLIVELGSRKSREIESARSAIRDLRNQLRTIGCADRLITERGQGFRFELKNCTVDAFEFERTIDPLHDTLEKVLRKPIEPKLALERLALLKPVIAMWNGNPAIGLPATLSFAARFDELKARADDQLLIALLCARDSSSIREAIIQLKLRPDPDELAFRAQLLAENALATSSISTLEKIGQRYGVQPPMELGKLIAALNSKHPAPNPFALVITDAEDGRDGDDDARDSTTTDDIATHRKHLPLASASLLELCATLGITTASNLQLEGSELSPLACVRRTRSKLYFSGVLASKWVEGHGVRTALKRLFNRLDSQNGDVRFLVINPNGDGFRRLSELRQNQISTDSVSVLKELAAEHSCFKVRLYDALPAFRIVVIDDDVVGFSPYRLAARDYIATNGGWQSPHVVLDPLAQYPLAEAFQHLFLETWKTATPLEEAL